MNHYRPTISESPKSVHLPGKQAVDKWGVTFIPCRCYDISILMVLEARGLLHTRSKCEDVRSDTDIDCEWLFRD